MVHQFTSGTLGMRIRFHLCAVNKSRRDKLIFALQKRKFSNKLRKTKEQRKKIKNQFVYFAFVRCFHFNSNVRVVFYVQTKKKKRVK